MLFNILKLFELYIAAVKASFELRVEQAADRVRYDHGDDGRWRCKRSVHSGQ